MPHVTQPIRPPGAVLDIVRRLQDAGFETWCVGGAVRDSLLGHPHLDWDLATAATPKQVQRLFDRTVPVGIDFGTVGVRDRTGHMHEVTTFRRDVQHDGRHAVVEFGASLDEDLARRDFTINAMAYDPLARRFHDPFGGRDDLTARVVRAVGDAQARMTEDRLRALRAIRFSARFDFDLHPDTWQAIVDSAPFLARLSPERVKQELEKTMEQVRHPSTAMRRWQTSGAFASLIPGLVSVSDDVLRAIDCLPLPGPPTKPQRKLLRLAALMSEMTAVECEQALRALRFSNADIAWVSALVGCWQREGAALARELREPGDISQARLRRLAASVGRLRCAAFVRLAAARWSTQQPSPEPARVRALYRRLLHVAFHEPVEVADLAINGDDLRALGVRPGPQLGRLLSELLELVLDDPARNTVAWLHAFVSERQRAGAANA